MLKVMRKCGTIGQRNNEWTREGQTFVLHLAVKGLFVLVAAVVFTLFVAKRPNAKEMSAVRLLGVFVLGIIIGGILLVSDGLYATT